jgi:hypothetical protein
MTLPPAFETLTRRSPCSSGRELLGLALGLLLLLLLTVP